MKEYTRREFFGLSGRFLLGLGLAYAVPQVLAGCADSITEQRGSALEQVMTGRFSPQRYLNDLFESNQSAVELKEEGVLKGFLYKPTDEEIRRLLNQNEYLEKFADEKELGSFVDYFILSYNKEIDKRREKTSAAPIPGLAIVMGKGLPMYISFFRDNLFDSSRIKSEADVEWLVKHELIHVRDFFYGMNIGRNLITGDIVHSEERQREGKLRDNFVVGIMELRAYYQGVKDALKEEIKSGEIPISSNFFGDCVFFYNATREALQNYAVNALEREVRDAQLAQFSDITTSTENGKFVLRYAFPEKKGKFVLVHNE